MSEQVLLGHKKFHKITDRDKLTRKVSTVCGAENLLQGGQRVLPKHQASVFRDECKICYD